MLRKIGLFSLDKRMSRVIHVCKYLMGRQDNGVRLTSAVFSDSTRGSGHKLKGREYHLNVRNNSLTVRISKPFHRFSREVAESPSLKIIKTWLGTSLNNLP